MPSQKAKKRIRQQHRLAVKCGDCQSEDGEPNLGQEGIVALKRCTACLSVSYCSRACQENHWHRHKIFCNLTRNWRKETDRIYDQTAELISLRSCQAFLMGTDGKKGRAYFASSLMIPHKTQARALSFYDFNGNHDISGRTRGYHLLAGEIRGLNDPDLEGENVFIEYGIRTDGKYLATLFVKLPAYTLEDDKPVFSSNDSVKITLVLCSIDEKCLNNVTFLYKTSVVSQRAPFLLWKYNRPCNQLKHTNLGWVWHGGGGQFFVLNPIWDNNWSVPVSGDLWEALPHPGEEGEETVPKGEEPVPKGEEPVPKWGSVESSCDESETSWETNASSEDGCKTKIDSEDEKLDIAEEKCHITQEGQGVIQELQRVVEGSRKFNSSDSEEAKQKAEDEEDHVSETVVDDPETVQEASETNNHEVEVDAEEENEKEEIISKNDAMNGEDNESENQALHERTDLTFVGQLEITPLTTVQQPDIPTTSEGYRLARIGRNHIVFPYSPVQMLVYSFDAAEWWNVEPRAVPGDALLPGKDSILYADNDFYVHRQYDLCRCVIFKLKFNNEYYGLELVANVDMAAQLHIFDYTRYDGPQVVCPAPQEVGDGGGGRLFLPIEPRRPPLDMHIDLKYFSVKLDVSDKQNSRVIK